MIDNGYWNIYYWPDHYWDDNYWQHVGDPNWLLMDEHLAWMGEWDATWSYNIDEVVLYKAPYGNEWHAFVSKISHNVGNIPTSTAFAWRRLYQEKFL